MADSSLQKMASLRREQEETTAKYEELQAKVKTLEQENYAKEQEIRSLSHNNQRLEAEVEKLETGINEHKKTADQSSDQSNQNENLQRRLQLLEEEADQADKNMRETNEKYVIPSTRQQQPHCIRLRLTLRCRLRQTDVKAGHYERKVQALEAERDQWEQKYDEMSKKYKQVQHDLHEIQEEIGNI